ncbi:MAG: hypothetical protein CVU74_02265 [Deltaproteobacteria bacterium HGW-Deltaproteobacteria-9]|nr:MAG: hypothetical protein CVU74_02265 [Deltaproteobacteria bacterium HGW-Deltaproteobacteria-9]
MTQENTAPADFLGLKTRREALRLTLKDICQSTRVSVVNLEAIENGEFQNLPVPIYTKNFIKTYARALDVESKPILDSYEAYLHSLKIDEAPIPEAVPEEEQEPFVNKLIPYKKYIATGAIVVIAAVVTLAILQQPPPKPQVAVGKPAIVATAPPTAVIEPVNPPEQAAPVTPSAPVTPPKAVAQPVVPATIKQAPQSLPIQPQQKSATPIKPTLPQNTPVVEKKAPALISEGTDVLVIKATEETWLRMKIDQNPPFQVLLKPGEAIERKGAGFTVDVGNAGGIIMQFKGKTIENLGKSGEVVHLQLP